MEGKSPWVNLVSMFALENGDADVVVQHFCSDREASGQSWILLCYKILTTHLSKARVNVLDSFIFPWGKCA